MSEVTERTSVVIGGLPRCGTTLLATFLASQRHVSFLTDYVSSFRIAANQVGGWRKRLSRTQRRIVLARVRDELLRYRHPVLVTVDEFECLTDLHERVLAELGRPGDVVVGHKLLLSDAELDAFLRGTRCNVVVLYRDIRDAAYSYFHRTGGGVEEYIEAWARMVRYVRRKPHARLHAIRYESMVSAPQSALQPLFDALGLPLDAQRARLVFNRGAAGAMPWPGNASLGQSHARPFDARAVGRWRSASRSRVVRYAAWRGRRELEEMGYAMGPAIAPAEALRWRAHHAAHVLVQGLDRGWDKARQRLLALAGPPLAAQEFEAPPTSQE